MPVSPIIGSNQRVILLLNQLATGDSSDANLRAYTFVAPSRDTDTSAIAIPIISPIQRSLISPVVQRMDLPEEEEELQAKPQISAIQSEIAISFVVD